MEVLNKKKSSMFGFYDERKKIVNIYSFDVLSVQKKNNNHLYSLT